VADADIVLASASEARARILKAAGLSFRVAPVRIDEASLLAALRAEGAKPEQAAETLAELKATRRSASDKNAFVIGADQVLACGDAWMKKPRDIIEARQQLLQLRGHSHVLATAIVVARSGTAVWRHVVNVKLKMRNFSDAFLENYLSTEGEAVLKSPGGYCVERLGVQLFERIEGDFFALIGLPLLPLLEILRANGAIGR
jgi:septum formation protein